MYYYQKNKNGVNMDKKLNLIEATSMAVGVMVGASIFSIFGVGVSMVGPNLPEVFVLSGIYALMVAYSYGKLGANIISNAGPIAYIHEGINNNYITGCLSVLLWLSYVISISLFAHGFSGYFIPLFNLPNNFLTTSLVEIGLVGFFTSLNFFGSKAVGKAEFWIVTIKVLILGLFVLFGIIGLNLNYLVPNLSPSGITGMIYASSIFFLSYMGFGVITNASENIENPKKIIPKAIYLSIFIVAIIYVGVSVAALGNMPLEALKESGENALAVAAKPFLGNLGFLLLSIGALFSISSAMNATIYGGANVAYSLAKEGELPKFFERKIWFKAPEGLYITSLIGIMFALFFNIESIASITSSIFMMIYIFVIISHYKLANKVGGKKSIILFNLLVISLIFIILMYHQFITNITSFFGTIALFTIVALFECYYKCKRKFNISKLKEGIENNINHFNSHHNKIKK